MNERPKWAKRLTAISLAIAIVALVWTINDIGLATLGRYLRRIGWWWLLVIPMEVITTTLDAIAIRAFASPDKPRLRATLLSQLAGRAVNAVTPSGNLGEVVKISVMTEEVSQSRAVSTIILYNIVCFSVEMTIVAVAAPFLAFLVPMPASMRWLILAAGAVCLLIVLGLNLLVRRGVLSSITRLGVRIRLISPARYERWELKIKGVDDKLRLVEGARRRDRWLGIGAVACSRLNSTLMSLMILQAVGEEITLSFIAAFIVGGRIIYFAASIVPMGLGVSESGYYGLYRALGENPARGVTLVIARRVVTVMYAMIGLLLVTTSETVKLARAKHKEKLAAAPPPTPVPVAIQVQPIATSSAGGDE
jgi:uncharacterized membrane protein YbhN (UPF0104 family)